MRNITIYESLNAHPNNTKLVVTRKPSEKRGYIQLINSNSWGAADHIKGQQRYQMVALDLMVNPSPLLPDTICAGP